MYTQNKSEWQMKRSKSYCGLVSGKLWTPTKITDVMTGGLSNEHLQGFSFTGCVKVDSSNVNECDKYDCFLCSNK